MAAPLYSLGFTPERNVRKNEKKNESKKKNGKPLACFVLYRDGIMRYCAEHRHAQKRSRTAVGNGFSIIQIRAAGNAICAVCRDAEQRACKHEID
jgi:hypothetical protein